MSSFAREYLSGSLASSFTYLIFAPLETIKTRMQLQDAPGYTRTYRHGMLPAHAQTSVIMMIFHAVRTFLCGCSTGRRSTSDRTLLRQDVP